MQREDEAMPTRTSSEPSPTEGWKTHHKRVSLDRAEAILSVIAFKLCFIKTSWSHQGTVADAVGTCLVLVDMDTDMWRTEPTPRKKPGDNVVEEARRFVTQLMWRCARRNKNDGKPATATLATKIKDVLQDLAVLVRTPGHDGQANPP